LTNASIEVFSLAYHQLYDVRRNEMDIFYGEKYWKRGYSIFMRIGICIFFGSFLILGSYVNPCARGGVSTPKEKPEGNVFNLSGMTIGSVDNEGNIRTSYGYRIGSVDKNGIVFNVSKIIVGKVDSGGKIVNQSGYTLGSVNTEGDVYNVNGRKLGHVEARGDIYLIGGAARLLIFKNR
jgi:hypothetical protein